MLRHVVEVIWYLSHQCTFHAIYYEDDLTTIGPANRNLYEIDFFLKNFQIIHHVRTAVDSSVFVPRFQFPHFYVKNTNTGQRIIYPHDYGVVHKYYDLSGQYNEIRVKSLYNFLEENRIWTSLSGTYGPWSY